MEKLDIKDILWEMSYFCNYNCPYCGIGIKEKKDASQKINKEKILNFFKKVNECTVTLSGGEPFIYPNFIEICKTITNNNLINLITNLSSDKIYEFGNTIDPKKVINIRISIHLTEMKTNKQKIEFIKRIKFLEEKGFKIDFTIVMWPPIFKKFESFYKEFEKYGIFMIPSNFRGFYNGKPYPQSYTKKELKIIRKYFNRTNKMYFNNQYKETGEIPSGYISFKGKLCSAGNKHIMIDINGNIKRCVSDKKIIGNINEGTFTKQKTSPCTSDVCICYGEGFYSCKEKPNVIYNKKIRKPIFNKLIKDIFD